MRSGFSFNFTRLAGPSLYPGPLSNVYFHLHLPCEDNWHRDRDVQNRKMLQTLAQVWATAFVSSTPADENDWPLRYEEQLVRY